ncbi:MAG: DoxX family protein [Crocinitomicaceae bacterium]|nr:DoxX family protein [Crocinitomicaceae bacterium]
MENIDLIVLVLQIGLGLVFLYFGSLKLFMSIEQIAKRVSWAHDYPPARIKLFGLIEVLGAIGLIAPYHLDIFPILTPMAATGLAMVMAGSAMVHLKRDEIKMIFLNIFIIFLLAGIGFNTLLDILGIESFSNVK